MSDDPLGVVRDAAEDLGARGFFAVLGTALLFRAAFLLAPVELNWREAQTGMQTRNLARTGWDWLHPRMDWGGSDPITVVMEFPAYNLVWGAIDAVMSTGHHLITGRVLALGFGLVSVWAVWRVGSLLVGSRVGLIAAAFYATTPLAWHLEAAAMPEAMWGTSVSLSLLGAVLWARGGHAGWAALAVGAAGMAMLIKLPQGGMMTLAIVGIWLHESHRRRGLELRIALSWVIAFAAAAAWYWHMQVTNVSVGSRWDFTQQAGWLMGTWGERVSPQTTIRFAARTIFYGGPLLVLGALVGLGSPKSWDQRWSYHEALILLAAAVSFQYVVVHGSFLHKHYQYILVLPLALIAAQGVAWLGDRVGLRLRTVVAIVLASQGVWSIPVMGKLWRDHSSQLVADIVAEVEATTALEDGIVVVTARDWLSDPASPYVLYLSDRRGLSMHPAVADSLGPEYLSSRGIVWVAEIGGSGGPEGQATIALVPLEQYFSGESDGTGRAVDPGSRK